MREIIMMLERELSNDGLIYIYRESDGKWYAYEQSAFYLSRMMLELSLDRYVMENALWLARAEIDVTGFLGIKLSVIANPNMYCTIPLMMGFMSGWLK